MRNLQELVRPDVWTLPQPVLPRYPRGEGVLRPYLSGRQGRGGGLVLLDGNENPYGGPDNRYPDPWQSALKQELAGLKGVLPQQIFLGNGSCETVDLCYRIFCQPGKDNVVAMAPSCGEHERLASINEVEYRVVQLDGHFQLSTDKVLKACDGHTKLLWICSPNNPTGNSLDVTAVETLLRRFSGIVVIDETYSDFSTVKPFRLRLSEFPNLIVLSTLDAAWACAGLQLGMAFASKAIVALMDKVKYPFNISTPVQCQAMEALGNRDQVCGWVRLLLQERVRMMRAVGELPFCQTVFPSDANFFLARFDQAKVLYKYLLRQGIVLADCTMLPLCEGCLRITIGTKGENAALLAALRQFAPK